MPKRKTAKKPAAKAKAPPKPAAPVIPPHLAHLGPDGFELFTRELSAQLALGKTNGQAARRASFVAQRDLRQKRAEERKAAQQARRIAEARALAAD